MKQTIAHAVQGRHTALDRLFRYAEFLNFGEIHIKYDHETGLRAIIAIHNLKRGPGIGGCRLLNYSTTDAALQDVLRLAYMMSLKAAVSDLPHGGAKAVILKPKHIKDRKALLIAYAQFVNELNGRYVTAVDSGTTTEDMDIIAEHTPYVTCTSHPTADSDPSIPTSLGVRRAIEAAVKFKLGKDSLEGVRIVVQGAGHVGYHLIKQLVPLGAQVTVTDIDDQALQRCVNEFGVTACRPNEVFDIEADVLSPCALGAILNHETIKRLRVSIIAGSANNQLAHHQQGILLNELGILYAPDFVINAGGLIYAAAMYNKSDPVLAREEVSNIYNRIMAIFERAASEKHAPIEIAESMAMARLK